MADPIKKSEKRKTSKKTGRKPGKSDSEPIPVEANHKILSVTQAATLLGIEPLTVSRHLRAGLLPGRKIGQVWFLSHDGLVEFIEEGNPEESK